MADSYKVNSDTNHGNRKPRFGRGGKLQQNHEASQVVIRRNPRDKQRILAKVIKIGTWNVKTMFQAGKIHNTIQEMTRLETDIMGISEMRWPNTGRCIVNDHVVYYSGNADGLHAHGVGIILSQKLDQYVSNFIPISARIMTIQLNTTPVKINIIQVYAPTADKSEEEIEEFYKSLTNTMKQLKKEDVTIIMGDLNAKIGQGKSGQHVGDFGLGTRNERGERLAVFAEEERYVIMNTFFKLPPRRLYTWISPQDQPDNIVRNQIDYLLINERFKNACLSIKTYPGADISSDHVPLIGKFKIKLKKVKRKIDKKQLNLRKLKEEETKELITRLLADELKSVPDMNNEEIFLEKLSEACEKIGNTHLIDKKVKKKGWMTDEILLLMEERRQQKSDQTKYNIIHKDIQKKIRTAKETWIREQCEEIEALERKHDTFNMHKKVKEAAGMYKTNNSGKIYKNNGKIVMDKREEMEVWEKYIEELFHDSRTEQQVELEDENHLPILVDEVIKTISQLKLGKAPGPDNMHSEFIKLMHPENVRRLTVVFNNIYVSGKIPTTWLKSTIIPLPKKTRAKSCEEYRTISLMSHLLKLFLKIIHQRIYKLGEKYTGKTQFGFRNAVGTREALFSIQVLFQRCRDVNCDIHACFIDYRKAFDRVKHDKLIEILKNIGINKSDLQIIKNLYWNQTSSIRIQGEESENINIKRGVRQGCVLSPLLFNVYSEHIFQEALEGINKGIKVNGEYINNIRYADDTVVFADSNKNLQDIMNRVNEISERYGLSLNIKKTKYMIISKNNNQNGSLSVNNQQIERAQTYTYLGTRISDTWDHSIEIKRRIEISRSAFLKMAKLFRCHDLSLSVKVRLLRCYVFPVLLYGVESWTLTEASCKRMEAFEMWLYRRILKIPWTDHVTNKDVLKRMGKDMEIMERVKTAKLEYLGHIMRNNERYGLLQQILQGKMEGKRGVGRRRISWLKNLRTWFNKSTTSLFRAAVDKVRIAIMIANIRNG